MIILDNSGNFGLHKCHRMVLPVSTPRLIMPDGACGGRCLRLFCAVCDSLSSVIGWRAI
jgi:hypothetical protein